MRNNGGTLSHELTWLAPMVCLGLMALLLWRPWPVFPPPTHYRMVTDATGAQVTVPMLLRGVMSTKAWNGPFLQYTHAPEALLKAGDATDRQDLADSLFGRIYPQLWQKDDLWNFPWDIESELAEEGNDVVYVWGGDKRLGMITFSSWPPGKTTDETVFTMARTMNALLGQEARGEELIATYRQAYENLHHDFNPQTLTHLPRVAGVVASSTDWNRLSAEGETEQRYIGMADAAERFQDMGRGQDAERILAMNPDIIILYLGEVDKFLHDPRWQGLKAVADKHVYANPYVLTSWPYEIDNEPLGTRWTAEIVHPGLLQPKLRTLLRDHYLKAYGYRLSDAEIDDMLRVEENKNMAGYSRFEKNNDVNNAQASSR